MLRSLLFIPGNSPAMLQNADVLGADAYIFDLEDAVSPKEKDAARLLVTSAIKTLDFDKNKIIVRINPLNTGDCAVDIQAIVPLSPAFIMPTKVSCAEDILKISELIKNVEEKHNLGINKIKLIPLIETAEGIENTYHIAKASERIAALFLGAEDLTSDMQAIRSKQGNEIAYARSRIVTAAKACSIEAIDTPFTDAHDYDGLVEDARIARSLGFTGKAAISPQHVEGINEAFTPTSEEINYARNVIEAIEEGERLGKGAVSLGGKMIDRPIVLRARKLLSIARQLGMEK